MFLFLERAFALEEISVERSEVLLAFFIFSLRIGLLLFETFGVSSRGIQRISMTFNGLVMLK
jgi:hypothetical protein